MRCTLTIESSRRESSCSRSRPELTAATITQTYQWTKLTSKYNGKTSSKGSLLSSKDLQLRQTEPTEEFWPPKLHRISARKRPETRRRREYPVGWRRFDRMSPYGIPDRIRLPEQTCSLERMRLTIQKYFKLAELSTAPSAWSQWWKRWWRSNRSSWVSEASQFLLLGVQLEGEPSRTVFRREFASSGSSAANIADETRMHTSTLLVK